MCYNHPGENMKKIIISILAILLLTGCQTQEKELKQYTKRTLTAGFDTEVVLIGYAYSEEEFDGYFQLLREEFLHYNEIFDHFKDYEGVNNIKTINDQAGIMPVEVDPDIIELIEFTQNYDEFNDQKFDMTFGAVLEIWHAYREAGMLNNQEDLPGKVPSITLLEEAKELTGYDLLEINKEDSTVFLTKEGASLDLGAIAKGWVTEQVAVTLEEAGLTHGAINAGGNVRTINGKPDGPWRIGVARPSSLNASSVDTITLDGSISMVTSGDYQRFYTDENGTIYHHLVDPVTLMPSNYHRSVTIITKDSGLADLFSTIFYLHDYQSGLELLERFNEAYPESQIGVLWVIDGDQEAPSDDFVYIDDNEFQIAVSENIQEYSRVFNP